MASPQIAFEPVNRDVAGNGAALVGIRLKLLSGKEIKHKVFVTIWLCMCSSFQEHPSTFRLHPIIQVASNHPRLNSWEHTHHRWVFHISPWTGADTRMAGQEPTIPRSIEITRTSIAQGQEGSAILVETY